MRDEYAIAEVPAIICGAGPKLECLVAHKWAGWRWKARKKRIGDLATPLPSFGVVLREVGA